MSYGSTFVQFDPNGKISSRLSRAHFRRNDSNERPHKLNYYDKEFDVSLSRVTETGSSDRPTVRDSMIAYSNKMKSIQDARRATGNTQGDPLFVRAKHIPKHPVRVPKKRRPMSFDELLGRDRESNRDRASDAKQRPHSDKHKPQHVKREEEIHLPMLTERLQHAGSNVQVSLVSASDLYELVDFSLRSKTTKAEHIQLRNLEAAAENSMTQRRRNKPHDRNTDEDTPRNDYLRFQRTKEPAKSIRKSANESSGDELVPSHSYYERVFSLEKTEDTAFAAESSKNLSKLPPLPNEILKRRPNRVKRMKLQDPFLEDIPEDGMIESGEIIRSAQIEITRRVISPPPPNSPRSLEYASKPPLDAILEQNEKTSNGVTQSSGIGRSYNTDSIGRNTELTLYRSALPGIDEAKTTKKMLLRDDGDVRIEVTQCPPKQDPINAKQKAQKRFKKLIFLRDGQR